VKNISDTKKYIVNYITKNPNSKVVDIIRYTLLSKQAIQKHLKELIELGLITKVGSPPMVFYRIVENKKKVTTIYNNVDFDDFKYIDASGFMHYSYPGFVVWCEERGYDPELYKEKWISIKHKYEAYKTDGLIDATTKFKNVFGIECSINEAYFSEFSSREIFGKTDLYDKLLLSKQTQNKLIFNQVFGIIKPRLLKLIKKLKIDYVVFVPPTVKRAVQLMTELEKYLTLEIPKISVVKIKNDISVPQKTLSKPIERKNNAINTFLIPNNQFFKGNILIIDDFIGSGSSINYIGQKVKNYNNTSVSKIFGYAICGSANGIIDNSKKFEVINEA
jgi:predicted amidophosphoribosyltransferase/DNA-binding transcriptional ArsR family regulator